MIKFKLVNLNNNNNNFNQKIRKDIANEKVIYLNCCEYLTKDNQLSDKDFIIAGPNNDYYNRILEEMMERVGDLQRRYYGHLLDEWMDNKQNELKQDGIHLSQKSNSFFSPDNVSNQTKKSEINNVYDTVADALDGQNGGNGYRRDAPPTPPPKPKLIRNVNDNSSTPNRTYNRPADLPDVDNHNLDKRKKDIEKWLRSMENRISEINYYYISKSSSSSLMNNNIDKTNDKKTLSNAIDLVKSEETQKNIAKQIYQLEVGLISIFF